MVFSNLILTTPMKEKRCTNHRRKRITVDEVHSEPSLLPRAAGPQLQWAPVRSVPQGRAASPGPRRPLFQTVVGIWARCVASQAKCKHAHTYTYWLLEYTLRGFFSL